MQYKVEVFTDPKNRPRDHEMYAALILAAHFKTDVVFLRPENQKTPDLDINDVHWEIKSPTGDGKKTMENNLRSARKQSQNIVISLSRSKMHHRQAISRINFYLRTESHRIKSLKVITKSGKVIDII
jgi:hypothetical protein